VNFGTIVGADARIVGRTILVCVEVGSVTSKGVPGFCWQQYNIKDDKIKVEIEREMFVNFLRTDILQHLAFDRQFLDSQP
jgi:hypothetical protein